MRYILGILATLGLIILILVLLLRGGDSSTSTTSKALVMSDYVSSGSAAEYIVDGVITADERHHTIAVKVEANQVSLTVYQGYEGDIIKYETYPNNPDAYRVFLKAIQNQGFTLLNTDKSLRDERGVCALGRRSIYSFDNGTKQVFRSWSTTCGSGTYKGKLSSVRSLFISQIPDYDKQVSGISLSR